jgi:cysteine desulfurase
MAMTSDKIYYFDDQATTPVDPVAIDYMMSVLKENYGNPHSSSHQMGWQAADVIEENRAKVAKVISAESSEIIFTSGATESNNLAIKGVANFYSQKGKHIITMNTEHKCVLNSCKFLESSGFEVTYLSPNVDGLLDLELLQKSIRPDTILISIMAVNNETGVIQDLKSIGEIARKHNVFFHTDAAQAFGKIPLDVNQMNIDLMSISSHKIYGPKGVGALYVRKQPRVRLSPIIHGGGQERGLRSGTLPTFLIAGFGKASEIALNEMQKNSDYVSKLSNMFLDEMLKVEDCLLNGNRDRKIPGCVNLSILHIEGESLMMAMPEICVTTGSACESSTLDPSYVINTMRCDTYYAHTAIRFGFSKFTTEEEVVYLINKLKSVVERLRKSSPLWEMKKAGIDFNSIEWDEEHH